MADNKSKCVFCGSSNHGRTCPFGPKKTHFHASTDSCGWCGSKTLYGPGCPFNPHSKYHQTGLAFIPMALEAAESGVIRGLLMKKLSEPITEMAAFKFGLIDESGKQIREAENTIERNCFNSTDRYLLRLRRLAENSIDLVNATLYIEGNEEYSLDELKVMYPIELECAEEVQKAVEDICKLSERYSRLGISSSKIEKLIAEAFLVAKKSTEGSDRSI